MLPTEESFEQAGEQGSRGRRRGGHTCGSWKEPTDSPETSTEMPPLGSVVRGSGQKTGQLGEICCLAAWGSDLQLFKTKSPSSKDRVCR